MESTKALNPFLKKQMIDKDRKKQISNRRKIYRSPRQRTVVKKNDKPSPPPSSYDRLEFPPLGSNKEEIVLKRKNRGPVKTPVRKTSDDDVVNFFDYDPTQEVEETPTPTSTDSGVWARIAAIKPSPEQEELIKRQAIKSKRNNMIERNNKLLKRQEEKEARIKYQSEVRSGVPVPQLI